MTRSVKHRTKTPPGCLQEAPRRPNLVPKTAQKPPKTPQEPPKSCPRGGKEAAQRWLGARRRPRVAQEPSKSRPDPLQTSILDHFGNDLIKILN